MNKTIKKLKAEARGLYTQIQRELDTVDCGISMLSMIRPSFGRLINRYDAIITELKKIDPEFPNG